MTKEDSGPALPLLACALSREPASLNFTPLLYEVEMTPAPTSLPAWLLSCL